jgi:hypothetical protein
VTTALPAWIDALHANLSRDGFAFAPAAPMHAALRDAGDLSDWDAFAESWNDLAFDSYLADHGRYRRRRHAVFSVARSSSTVTIEREAHQPHYQAREYNPLQGGIQRWFDPVGAGDGPSLRTILRFCQNVFGGLAPEVDRWHVEIHQFRIEAHAGQPGQPTPEGVHRDGVDYVLVLLIRRTNIARGTTTIHARDGRLLGSFTLAEPFDAALVDDARVYHGVTPVEAVDAALPACRDVLVVTFKRSDRPGGG